jgi:hypothetical protein
VACDDKEKKEKPNFFQKVVRWVEEMVEWVEATFSDPVLSAQIRADLGLDASGAASTRSVDPGTKAKIEEFACKQDIDEASLMAVVAEVKALVDTGMTFADAVKTQGVGGMDVLWLLFKVWVADSLRARNPAAYGLCRLVGIITEDDEALGTLDLGPIGRLLEGKARGDAEDVIDRLSFLVGTTVVALDSLVGVVGGAIDAAYGWDPEPTDDPTSVGVAGRALTVKIHLPDLPVSPVVTLIGVPTAHGGPGILLSLGAALQVSHTVGNTTYTFSAGANGAFAVYIGAGSPRVLGGFTPSVALRTEPAQGAAGKPALLLGTSNASRLEIGALAWGIEVGADFAAFRLAVRRGKLVVSLGKGDGFLRSLPGGSIEVPFDLGLIADTKHGVRFEGGTGLKVNLPVAASLFGVFTVQYVELELVLGARVQLDLRGGFSLKLGPFSAAVDKLGLAADLTALTKGADVGSVVKFLPPKGIGLRLDAGVVKGGGYLFIDAERGEYAGALELTFVGICSVKAICLVTTKRPDGSEGWSLLLLIFGQFSAHIAFGIFLTGFGGLIGLHHRVEVQPLIDGMKTGVLDDILFPANPVGDAPRIINRYRQLFPIEPDSLVLGPMLELAFSKPPIVYVRLGLLFEVRNALGGDRPVALTKVVLIGQLLAQLPPKATGSPAILKLLVDVVGFYDAQEQFLMIRARLRDSFVGIEGFATLNLSGELLLAMRFGSDPSFVLSAGGFHPAFKDIPKGVPAVLERMAISFGFGPIQLRCESYFAITSNSVQTGFRVVLSATFGPASIEGHLGFDALIYLKPRFRFIVGLDFAVSLKAFGTSLCAVSVAMQLEGPGEWHAIGHFTFSILWWDVEVGFDEKWGTAPAVEEQTTSAKDALLAELSKPERVLPEAPVGGNSLVTLASAESGPVPFAHPLGKLTIKQRAIPFEVTIDRLGTKRLTEGTVRYSVSDVIVGGTSTKAVTPVVDHFSRGQFMELSEQERLGGKSFERFPCGVSVGTDAYRVDDAGRAVEAKYEEKILEPEPLISRFPWGLVPMGVRTLSDTLLGTHVAFGAAAKSARAVGEALASGGPGGGATVHKELSLAIVDATSLAPVASMLPMVAGSDAIAHQAAGPGSVVVEAFELAGV